jgi:hypothetical protein
MLVICESLNASGCTWVLPRIRLRLRTQSACSAPWPVQLPRLRGVLFRVESHVLPRVEPFTSSIRVFLLLATAAPVLPRLRPGRRVARGDGSALGGAGVLTKLRQPQFLRQATDGVALQLLHSHQTE